MADPVYISPNAKLEAKNTPWWTTDANSAINQLYYTLVQSPYNKLFNSNDQEAISMALSTIGIGGPVASSSQSMMPALGKNNPRIQELYKKLIGFYPYGKVEVNRRQFEDPSTLASHESRGGIFVSPTEHFDGSNTLIPVEYRNSPELKDVTTTVELNNPLLKFGDGLVGAAFGEWLDNNRYSYGGKHVPKKFEKLYNTLLERSMQSREATGYEQDRTNSTRKSVALSMVYPDLVAAKLAKDNGFDALIPAMREYKQAPLKVQEMMLLPNRKEGKTIYRDESKTKWKLPDVPEHKYFTVENSAGEKFGVVPLEGYTQEKVQVLFDVFTKHHTPEFAIKQLKALGAIK